MVRRREIKQSGATKNPGQGPPAALALGDYENTRAALSSGDMHSGFYYNSLFSLKTCQKFSFEVKHSSIFFMAQIDYLKQHWKKVKTYLLLECKEVGEETQNSKVPLVMLDRPQKSFKKQLHYFIIEIQNMKEFHSEGFWVPVNVLSLDDA